MEKEENNPVVFFEAASLNCKLEIKGSYYVLNKELWKDKQELGLEWEDSLNNTKELALNCMLNFHNQMK